MANKASGQVTVVDITDAYSVLLTSESYTFVGNTTGAPSGLSCTTQVVAYCGTQQCSKVSVSTVACPAGISATISNNNTVSPTITFKTTATITAACEATIPVTVDGVTINKKFSFAVAKQGNAGKSIATLTTNYSYTQSDIDQYSANGYSGTWACSDTSGIKVDDTILLRITNTSKNGYSFVIAKVTAIPSSTYITCTSLGLLDKGDTGDKGSTGKGISSVTPQYYISTSKTSTTGGSWSDTAPTTIEKGKYLWTRMKVVYMNPSSTEYTTAIYDSMTDSRIEQLKDSITLEITGPDGVKSSIAMDDEGKIALTGDVMAQRINVDELMARKLTSTGGLDVTGDFYVKNSFGSITQATNEDGYNLTEIATTTDRNGYIYESSLTARSNIVDIRTKSTAPEGSEDGTFKPDLSYVNVGNGLNFWTIRDMSLFASKGINIATESNGGAEVSISGDNINVGTATSTMKFGDKVTIITNETDAQRYIYMSGPVVFSGPNIQINTTELWRNGRSIAFGEWTPTIYGATVSSYSKQQGWYLKFGNVVIIGWYLYVKFASNQTSNKYVIQGLPYTPAAVGTGGGICSGYYSANQVNFSGWYASPNGRIYGYGVTNGAAGNKWAEEKIFCGTGDSYSTGTIIYTTSAS